MEVNVETNRISFSLNSYMVSRRIMYFLGGCIGTRSLLTYVAKARPDFAQKLSLLSLAPVAGWLYIYFVSGRDTGPEVFGGTIWWNELRIPHAMLWSLFSLYAWKGKSYAWIPLAIDTILGLCAWIIYSISVGWRHS